MTVRGFLLSVARDHRRDLLVLGLWSAVQLGPTAAVGWLLAVATDRGFLAGDPATGVLALVAVAAAAAAGAACERLALPRVATVVEAVRDRLTVRVVTGALGRAVYDGADTGTAGGVAKIVQQVEATRQILAGLLLTMRGVVIGVLGALVGLLALEPVVAVVTVPALAVAAALVVWLARVMARRCRDLLDAQEDLAARTTGILGGLRDVIACGAGHTATATLGRAVERQRRASAAVGWGGAGRVGVVLLGARLPLVVVLLAAPLLADHVTPGGLVGILYYFLHGLEPALQAIAAAVGNIGAQLTVTMRSLVAVTSPDRPPEGDRAVSGTALRLEGVTFGYNDATPVLDRVDLLLRPGAHVAVVGPSGVGKSTLVSLLAGLDRPTTGRVTLGGVPLEHLREERLRATITLLPQEGYVFAGSLRENLAYLNPAVTDQTILSAATEFGLGPAIDRLGGLAAHIDPQCALSDGERQLITLVRAYLGPARVVLLDEATCHLDPAAEARAEQLFARRGGTLVVVAHRISAALRAEQVLIVDDDGLTLGTHPWLMANNHRYADLMAHWLPSTV